jgi:hypothetical protein
VRFAKKLDGTPDGGVHQLFTIAGRSDIFPAGQPNTCTAAALPPTDFETQYRQGNLRFRIPLQLFGLGILDSIQDREILSRHDATHFNALSVSDKRDSGLPAIALSRNRAEAAGNGAAVEGGTGSVGRSAEGGLPAAGQTKPSVPPKPAQLPAHPFHRAGVGHVR